MLDGRLKSLLLLWQNLARNLRYADFIVERDINTFEDRVAREGLPFLTVALPSLGKALDTFHATNTWKAPIGFKTDQDGIPLFLGLAIRSALSGNSVAVDCVRQMTYIFYKLEVPHESETNQLYLDQFISTDRDVAEFDYNAVHLHESLMVPGKIYNTANVIECMAGLIRRVLCNEDPMDIRPCHGSGATACRTPNHEKWHKLRYYEKLDQVYDYPTYFFYSPTHVADELDKLMDSDNMEPTARVCLVPKDSRGPRIISCEPAELMYIQQGLMRKLYRAIENHPLTRGQINFTDQSINRELARFGSRNGFFSTLDLKDASDRVSLELVRRVFPPNWVQCLEACRSEKTILPNGIAVKLAKFAPMGSACCFPVEALVFWACAVATTTLIDPRKRYPIYVYGDDIICDTGIAPDVVKGLESINLLVNREKSFMAGPFRESCGGDYHNGYDVTPVRVRHWLVNVGTGLETCADLANSFIAKFGYDAVHKIVRLIEQEVGYVYPRTLLDLPLTVRAEPCAVNDSHFTRRFNKNLFIYEYRTLTSTCKALTKQAPNWGELLRKDLSREVDSVLHQHPLAIVNARCEPGQYVDIHATRKSWTWTWLG